MLFSALALLALFGGETAVRLTKADARLMRPLLRHHAVYEVPAYMPSPNPGLIYQLSPDKRGTLPTNAAMTTNSLGFRDKSRSVAKHRGVYRIICFGGDFTYGTAVQDADTFPAQLEDLLNHKYAGHFEVWNAGIRHGTLAYQTALAEQASALYKPDLLLFQTGEIGPRAFLPNMALPYYFSENNELFLENLRYIPFPSSKLGKFLLDNCALYRFGVIFLNNCVLINRNNPLFPKNGQSPDTLNLLHLETFLSEEARPPALIFRDYGFTEEGLDSLPSNGKNIRPLMASCYTPQDLPPHHTQEYLLTTPPAHVFRWYADCAAKELEKRGYIKKK